MRTMPRATSATSQDHKELLHRIEEAKTIPMKVVAEQLGLEYVTSYHVLCVMANHASDSVASMKYYENTNSFSCFGCKAGGSNVDLVMGVRGWSLPKALFWIEAQILHKPSVRARYKSKEDTFSSLAEKLKAKRASSTKDEFSVLAFKQQAIILINREVSGIKSRVNKAVFDQLIVTIDGCFETVDSIPSSTSKESCDMSLLELKTRLSTLSDIAEAEQESYLEYRGINRGYTEGSSQNSEEILPEVQDDASRGGHSARHNLENNNSVSLLWDELPGEI